MTINPHTLLVLGHIVALALGLGAALLADWIVLRKMTFGIVSQRAAGQLIDLSHAVCIGLGLIWVTGALLVADNALSAPASIMNQKLWAKLVIVTILTLNALLLHRIVLPMVKRRIGQPLFETVFDRGPLVATLLGAVSAVSWAFAAYLGLARELNGNVDLTPILGTYLAALLLAWAGAIALIGSMQHHRMRSEFGRAHAIQGLIGSYD